jgi:alkylation response protein AidB-like acyl-CoA dehydrogenase
MIHPISFDDPRSIQLRETARRRVREHLEPHGVPLETAGTAHHAANRALGAEGLLGLCHASEDGDGANEVMLEEVAKRLNEECFR